MQWLLVSDRNDGRQASRSVILADRDAAPQWLNFKGESLS